jgi:hypothetical protein
MIRRYLRELDHLRLFRRIAGKWLRLIAGKWLRLIAGKWHRTHYFILLHS